MRNFARFLLVGRSFFHPLSHFYISISILALDVIKLNYITELIVKKATIRFIEILCIYTFNRNR